LNGEIFEGTGFDFLAALGGAGGQALAVAPRRSSSDQ